MIYGWRAAVAYQVSVLVVLPVRAVHPSQPTTYSRATNTYLLYFLYRELFEILV